MRCRSAFAKSFVVSVFPVPAGPASSARCEAEEPHRCTTEAERLGAHQRDVAPLNTSLKDKNRTYINIIKVIKVNIIYIIKVIYK